MGIIEKVVCVFHMFIYVYQYKISYPPTTSGSTTLGGLPTGDFFILHPTLGLAILYAKAKVNTSAASTVPSRIVATP